MILSLPVAAMHVMHSAALTDLSCPGPGMLLVLHNVTGHNVAPELLDLGLSSKLRVGVIQGSMSVRWCLRLQEAPPRGGLSPGSPPHPLLCYPLTCIPLFR